MSMFPQHTRIYEEMAKIIFQLSSSYALYLFFCMSVEYRIGRHEYLILRDPFFFFFFWAFVKLTKVVCIDIALCVMVHGVEISPSFNH